MPATHDRRGYEDWQTAGVFAYAYFVPEAMLVWHVTATLMHVEIFGVDVCWMFW